MADHTVVVSEMYVGETDRELVRRILACGDSTAKRYLWERYQCEVEKVVAGELKDARRPEVEDIASEVWLTVLDPNKLCQWRADTPSVLPWIRQIARNKVIDHYRRLREFLWPSGEGYPDPQECTEDPETRALDRIARARLMEAIFTCAGGLTHAEAMAFHEWLHGGSLTDLAYDMGKLPNAVYQDLNRAKKKVFRQLCRHYKELLPGDDSGRAPRLGRRRG
jgi:RNA polymerase sigma factor (sigma-70 family)